MQQPVQQQQAPLPAPEVTTMPLQVLSPERITYMSEVESMMEQQRQDSLLKDIAAVKRRMSALEHNINQEPETVDPLQELQSPIIPLAILKSSVASDLKNPIAVFTSSFISSALNKVAPSPKASSTVAPSLAQPLTQSAQPPQQEPQQQHLHQPPEAVTKPIAQFSPAPSPLPPANDSNHNNSHGSPIPLIPINNNITGSNSHEKAAPAEPPSTKELLKLAIHTSSAMQAAEKEFSSAIQTPAKDSSPALISSGPFTPYPATSLYSMPMGPPPGYPGAPNFMGFPMFSPQQQQPPNFFPMVSMGTAGSPFSYPMPNGFYASPYPYPTMQYTYNNSTAPQQTMPSMSFPRGPQGPMNVAAPPPQQPQQAMNVSPRTEMTKKFSKETFSNLQPIPETKSVPPNGNNPRQQQQQQQQQQEQRELREQPAPQQPQQQSQASQQEMRKNPSRSGMGGPGESNVLLAGQSH